MALKVLGTSELKEFLSMRGTVKRGPHQMTKKAAHWPYCSRCGLVALKNELTRQALSKECVTEE